MALDKFPVDESALPRVTITDQKLEEWKEVAHEEITRALSNRHSWYNAFKEKIREGYDMIADKPNLKAFIRAVPNTSDKDILIRSTFDNVTLDDIAYGVYSESSYEVRCAFAHMYEENFLDGGILHTHETRTIDDPLHFVGVRWIAFRSPAPKIVTSRDFVFFSYEGTMLDVKGERVLFRFLRTMPMEDVPVDSSKLPPLVRGKISNLHFYRQNGSHVEAYVKASHSNAGSMPSYVATKTISFMYPGVTNMETIGDARALMHQGMTRLNPSRSSGQSSASLSSSTSGQSSSTRAPPSLASANACGVCYHKFKMTRSKRQCHGCSRTVCKRCTRAMWFFDEQKQMSSTGVVKLRFCQNCVRHARSESSFSRSSLERAHSTKHSDMGRHVNLEASRIGSGGSAHSLHRVSSQNSMASTPSHESSSYNSNSFNRTPRQGSSSTYSLPRAPSHDNLHQSFHRVPSQENVIYNVHRGVNHDNYAARQPSQTSQASSYHSKSSNPRSQPEAEFSDEEILDDDLLDLHDGSFIQPTQSPANKLYASRIMTKTLSSSQMSMSGRTTTSTFDSSQVINAFDGSPVSTTNPMERTHINQYTGMGIPIMHASGDSEEEDEDDEDFGDFHDSDSDDIDGDVDEELGLEQTSGVVNHHDYDDLDESLRDTNDGFRDTNESFSDAYSVFDSDDYSIAGSFSYEMGSQSFMSEIGGESFSFDIDDGIDASSRGSFVPLTMLEQPSIVAQQFAASSGPRGPMVAPPVPQLTQRRLPLQQQRPMTLRNYPPPTGTLDETSEFDGSLSLPPAAATKAASRTSSTPNLLAYGATKRTHRPVVAGMAPVRRAASGSGAGVIVNGVNHAVQSPRPNDLANEMSMRLNLHDANDGSRGIPATGGATSPMVRYYGS